MTLNNYICNQDQQPNVNFFSRCSSPQILSSNNTNNADDFTATSKFLFLHQNIRSMRANFDLFLVNLAALIDQPAIIFLSEIWINEEELCNYSIVSYKIESKCSIERAGGVLAFIRTDLKYTCKILTMAAADGIQIDCVINNEPFTFVCIYRLHSHSPDIFLNELKCFLNSTRTKNLFILGDINIDLLKESKIKSEYLLILSSCGMYSLINEPTRILNNCISCIDHVFIRQVINPKYSIDYKVEHRDITDHAMTSFELKFSNRESISKSKPVILEVYDYPKLNSLLAKQCWDDVFVCTDTNTAFNTFINIFNFHLFACKSTKTLIQKHKKIKPWITDALCKRIELKNHLFVKMKNHPLNDQLKCRYLKLKKSVAFEVKKCSNEYYHHLFDKFRKKPKAQWRVIDSLINNNNTDYSMSELIDHDGNRLQDDYATACFINNYFSTITKQLRNELVEKNVTINESEKSELLFNSSTKTKNCFLAPILGSEIMSIIHGLENSSCCGLDGISNRIVKNVATFLVDPLKYIFNLSISSGEFPSQLKKALVIPLFKSGDKKAVGNYRPISLLPIFSKILEKCIKIRFVNFLEKTKFLSKAQFGFRANLSTEDALLEFLTPVFEGLNNNNKAVAAFIDIKKAFDTVDHRILLSKLYMAGFRGVVLDWIGSYLRDRKQQVKVNNILSSESILDAGVPQGSVLGPIFFLIYFDSFCKLDLNGKIVAFADDVAFCYVGSPYSKIKQDIEVDFLILRKWLNLHSMVLSPKSKLMRFDKKDSSTMEEPIISHSLFCSSNCNKNCFPIPFTSDFKYLGITLDCGLKFNSHIEKLKNSLNMVIRKLYVLREICPTPILRTVYFSLFNSRLEYGVSAWGGVYLSNLKPLIIAQKYAIRVIYKKNIMERSFPLFLKSKVLPLRHLYVYKVLKIFYFRGGYRNVKSGDNYNLRINNRCIVPFTRKEYCRRFYIFMAPFLFNLLPQDLKASSNQKEFLKNLKLWLFNQSNIEMFF